MSSPGRWYFYALDTGRLTGRTLSGLPDLLQANTPAGQGAVQVPPGTVLDPRNRRVNLATGQLEAWQPPAPPADELRSWAWDKDAECWRSVPTLAARKLDLRTPLLQELAAEDARALRPVAELVAALAGGTLPAAGARAVLSAIEQRKTALRQALAAIDTAGDEQALASAAAARRAGG